MRGCTSTPASCVFFLTHHVALHKAHPCQRTGDQRQCIAAWTLQRLQQPLVVHLVAVAERPVLDPHAARVRIHDLERRRLRGSVGWVDAVVMA